MPSHSRRCATGEDPTTSVRPHKEQGLDDVDGGRALVSARAAEVLRFSEERDPAALAQFVQLRVIDPEGVYWRRGIEAATRWRRETKATELRVPYTYVTPEDWGAVGNHPLGVFIADQRRYYAAGSLEASRVEELERLGMVWSVHASAWDAGLEVARSYAAVHGHFLPRASAVWEDAAIGTWAKNMRAAARKTRENAARRDAGEAGVSSAGELSPAAWTRWRRLIRGGARSGTSPGGGRTGSRAREGRRCAAGRAA